MTPMRTPSFILSVLLHLSVLTGLLLSTPAPEPSTRTRVATETQATLLTEVAVAKKPNASTTSLASPTETTPQTITNRTPESSPQAATPQMSSTPEHPVQDVTHTNVKASSTPSNGAPLNAHSSSNNNLQNNSSATSGTSTLATPPTATQGGNTLTATLAAASTAHDAKNDTSPVRNRPQTTQMACTPSAKRQGIIGQVMAHVQISVSGIVQTARISGSSQDSTMNQLAHEQAMRLKFPIVRNAAGTAVSSYADVKLTFDCSSD